MDTAVVVLLDVDDRGAAEILGNRLDDEVLNLGYEDSRQRGSPSQGAPRTAWTWG
jgi:hypothetical protein